MQGNRGLVTESGATLTRLPLVPGEFHNVELRFTPGDRPILGTRVLALDAIQLNEKKQIVGGQRFYVRTGLSREDHARDRNMRLFDGVSWRRA